MLRRALARAPLRLAFAAAGTTAATYSLAEAASPTSLDAAAAQPIVAKLSSMRNRALCFSSEEKVDLVVVSPTFFPSVSDTRCQLGLEACRRAGNRQRAARDGERVFKELTPPPSFCVTSLGRSLGAGGLAALAKRCGVDPATLPPPRPAGERRRGK